MILDTILWITLAILGCIGFVQATTWGAIRAACKGNRTYKVVPVGGNSYQVGRQIALVYTSLQWESNPCRQVYVLYNVGLDEQGEVDCEDLAAATGVLFVRTQEELLALLHGEKEFETDEA